MRDAEAQSTPSALRAALLDYFDAPGKCQLTLRQPVLLFASVREILQVAAGRGPAAGEARLREAAMFFIRAALLYPGADHYAVLGLAKGAAPAELKERYRLLMRLIHPDFATGSPLAWPADAAVRVNRAYEVLSSAVMRREYDEQLAGLHSQRQASAGPARFPSKPVPARRPAQHRPRLGRKASWILGLALTALGLLLLLPRPEQQHLVQRVRTPVVLPPPPQRPARAETVVGAAPAQRPSPQPSAVAEPEAPPRAAVPEAVISAPPSPPAAPPAAPPVPAPAVAAAPLPAPVAPVAVPATAASPVARTPPVPASQPRMVARSVEQPRSVGAVVPPVAEPPRPAAQQPVAMAPVAPAQAVTPIASPAASAVAAIHLTTTLALPAVASPTLGDAQPLLTELLQQLESGSGEQLLRLLDDQARGAPGAQALSRQYDQLVRGARPVQLSQVEFRGERRDGVLLVFGRVRLHAGEPTIGSLGQKLLLRAEFMSRGGKVQLTGLSGGPE